MHTTSVWEQEGSEKGVFPKVPVIPSGGHTWIPTWTFSLYLWYIYIVYNMQQSEIYKEIEYIQYIVIYMFVCSFFLETGTHISQVGLKLFSSAPSACWDSGLQHQAWLIWCWGWTEGFLLARPGLDQALSVTLAPPFQRPAIQAQFWKHPRKPQRFSLRWNYF